MIKKISRLNLKTVDLSKGRNVHRNHELALVKVDRALVLHVVAILNLQMVAQAALQAALLAAREQNVGAETTSPDDRSKDPIAFQHEAHKRVAKKKLAAKALLSPGRSHALPIIFLG